MGPERGGGGGWRVEGEGQTLTRMTGCRQVASCSMPAALRFTPSGIKEAWILPMSPS